jgi:hypothetical protein
VYHRYHIETLAAPDVFPVPSRFRVKVKKRGLAALLIKEIIHYRGRMEVVLSRPCLYGVFSGPVGGFAPREQFCVGCLRCTTQYPDFVQISPNPERKRLGDSYFTSGYVDAILYEAATGRVPVRGAGYRGRFGGEKWDGMWTDMSEIVRPTRDGIHGRETISTMIDIGPKPAHLVFDEKGGLVNGHSRTVTVPLPLLLDGSAVNPPEKKSLRILARAAREEETLLIVPIGEALELDSGGEGIVPLMGTEQVGLLEKLPFQPAIVELEGADEKQAGEVQKRFPETHVCVRLESGSGKELKRYAEAGIRVFHLVANYHGKWPDGRFMLDVIRDAHKAFVEMGRRDEMTVLGSGGIIGAEHVAKAILCGLDAVVLDTPPLVAMQGKFLGECVDRRTSRFELPARMDEAWGVQRVKNLLGSWRDQLLEVLGAMGLREVRRLRGEMGRAMFQRDLEEEAFAEIEGYR